MQNKDKGDGIKDSPLDMLLVILLDGASKEVVMPSSLMPQIKGTLIKIECFKIKPCPSQKKMTRVRGNNIT